MAKKDEDHAKEKAQVWQQLLEALEGLHSVIEKDATVIAQPETYY